MAFDEAVLDGVEGWLWPDEAAALYDAARNGQTDTVAEIGCHKGRGTITLALGLEDRGEGTVLAIDPTTERSKAKPARTGGGPGRPIWRAPGSAVVLSSMPLVAMKRYLESGMRTLGALFIDGSHEYEDVVLDIDDWIPRLVPGAFVLFNDPVLPGVAKAIRDRVCVRRSSLRFPALLTNTVWMQYLPEASWTLGDELRRIRLVVALVLAPRLVRRVELWGSGGGPVGLTCKGRLQNGARISLPPVA